MLKWATLLPVCLGTASSSNTMVPGGDGHHEGKMKENNVEDK